MASVLIAECDLPPRRVAENFEMPEDSNVYVLTDTSPGLISVGKTSSRGDVRWKVRENIMEMKNPTNTVQIICMTIPEEWTCLQKDGTEYLKSWYTTDDDDTMVDITTIVVHLQPRQKICPFRLTGYRKTLTEALLSKKLGSWAAIGNEPHPDPFPKSQIMLIGFPLLAPENTVWRCGQSYEGGLTHYGLYNCHSVDFACEEGTQIIAARDGIVTTVEDSHCRSGGHVDHLFNGYNQIVVKHSNGTEACYLHIQESSSLVTVNQTIKKGQPLALTGSVGFSPWPHLHFQMNKTSSGEEFGPSVPFAFESPVKPFIAVAGYNYTAKGKAEEGG